MNRRGFLARLFAAPIVALALLKAPVAEPEPEQLPDLELVSVRWDGKYRFDVLYGSKAVRPEFAVRIAE